MKSYFNVDDDIVHKPPARHTAACTEVKFTCDVCGVGWESHNKLAVHKWAKHRIKSDVRTFIGDTSKCVVCGTDFRSRARLVKHLLERRTRSTTRGTSCQEAFLSRDPAPVPYDKLRELEARDAAQYKAERKMGHTSVIAKSACLRTQPSILLQQPVSD